MKYVHLEALLGRVVVDAQGKKAGHIRSITAKREGSQCLVSGYELGTAALLLRFGIVTARLVGLPFRHRPTHVPWELMDLSDPEHPRLKVSIDQLA